MEKQASNELTALDSLDELDTIGTTATPGRGNNAHDGPSATSRLIYVPTDTIEIQVDTSVPRDIRLTYQTPRGKWRKYTLKVTAEGGMQLI